MSFYPLFNPNVYVENANGTRNRVNPENCLYPNSAFELQNILGANGYPCALVSGPALGAFDDVFKGGYDLSSTVPWFAFDGKKPGEIVYERAGSLGAYWVRATNADTQEVDEKTALRNALTDVKNVIEGN